MRQIFVFLISSLPFLLSAQPERLIGEWTNGLYAYECKKYNDSLLLFEGADLHEGGYDFTVIVKKDNSLSIWGRDPGLKDNLQPEIGSRGDEIDYRVLNGFKVLIVKNRLGMIKNLLREMYPGESLEQLVLADKTNYDLSGKYINRIDNKEVVISAGKPSIIGLTGSDKYHFEDEFDCPVNVITFENKKSFYYVHTDSGLNIFRAQKVGEDNWEKKEKVMYLEKIYWFNLSNSQELKGRYQFASTYILIDNILSYFSQTELKMIRNEIFARHGYIFKGADMKDYFAKQEWYKSKYDNVDDKLSELEKLNIELIKRYEMKLRNKLGEVSE
jgi:hypothetical protein